MDWVEVTLESFEDTWTIAYPPPPPVNIYFEKYLPTPGKSLRLPETGILTLQAHHIHYQGKALKLEGKNPGTKARELAGRLVATGRNTEEDLAIEGKPVPELDGVLICGGWGAASPSAAISRKIRCADELDFFAVSSSEWPWGTAGEVLTLDMGRAMLKTGYCGIQRKFARNFDKFPLGKAVARERKHCRRDITTFAGRKLAAVVREAARQPEMLLIAFPGKVSPEGTPLEEAWPGLSDWQEAAVTIRNAAGLDSSRLLICSATELAAWSALMAPVAADWDRFAVITAGAGVRLAIVDRSEVTGTMTGPLEKNVN